MNRLVILATVLLMLSCKTNNRKSETLEGWNERNRPEIFDAKAMKFAEISKPEFRYGELQETPWSDDYWPLKDIGYLKRYADPNIAQKIKFTPEIRPADENNLLSTKPVYTYNEYILKNTKAYYEIFDGIKNDIKDSAFLNAASPAEKYDYATRDDQMRFTQHELLNYLKNFYNYEKRDVPWGWMGFCHGWAPASIVYKKPKHGVYWVDNNGGNSREIVFTEGDIRGYLTRIAADMTPKPVQQIIGERCEIGDAEIVKRDDNGRIVDGIIGDWNGSNFENIEYTDFIEPLKTRPWAKTQEENWYLNLVPAYRYVDARSKEHKFLIANYEDTFEYFISAYNNRKMIKLDHNSPPISLKEFKQALMDASDEQTVNDGWQRYSTAFRSLFDESMQGDRRYYHKERYGNVQVMKVQVYGAHYDEISKKLVLGQYEMDSNYVYMKKCRDLNPATFHLVLAQTLSKWAEENSKEQFRGFVMDKTRTDQVWNHPVYKFVSKMGRPTPLEINNDLSASVDPRDATELKAEKFVDPFREFRNPGDSSGKNKTTHIVDVYTKIWYGIENGPKSHYSSESTSTEVYRYTLELDKDGVVVGGEWLGIVHGDFDRVVPQSGTELLLGLHTAAKKGNFYEADGPDFVWRFQDKDVEVSSTNQLDAKFIKRIHECSLTENTDFEYVLNDEKLQLKYCSAENLY